MLDWIGLLLGRLVIVLLCVWGAWFCALGLRDMVWLRRTAHRDGERDENEAGAGSFWFRAIAMLAAIGVFAAVATAAIVSLFVGQ